MINYLFLSLLSIVVFCLRKTYLATDLSTHALLSLLFTCSCGMLRVIRTLNIFAQVVIRKKLHHTVIFFRNLNFKNIVNFFKRTCCITKCHGFFITKCNESLLENALGFLLQTATVITNCDDFTAKCDVYYKLRQYRSLFQQQLKYWTCRQEKNSKSILICKKNIFCSNFTLISNIIF